MGFMDQRKNEENLHSYSDVPAVCADKGKKQHKKEKREGTEKSLHEPKFPVKKESCNMKLFSLSPPPPPSRAWQDFKEGFFAGGKSAIVFENIGFMYRKICTLNLA